MKTVLIINKDQMGHGDRDLGRKVLGTFLRKAISMDELTAIALFNSGVKLASQDSPVLTELTLLHENGVDVLPCGTCVEHFGIEAATGSVSDMDTILREIDRAEKVVTI